MPIKPITIEQATPDQKADYARNFLQLDLRGTESPTEIDALIAKAQPNNTMMFVNEPDAPEDVAAAETVGEVPLKPEEASGKQAGTLGKGDPRAVIMIPPVETEDGSGARDVLVGVNGRAWQLKRGVDLPVPWRVVEALQNAVADTVRHRSDEGHEGEVTVTKTRRFNFEFIEKPSAAEIADWRERTGKQFCA
jgi:hypothetical protein